MADAIGIIGLGIMGSAHARNLTKGGFAILGCDVDAGRFATLADIHRAATAPGFAMSDPAVVLKVVEGLAG